jgi:glycosyltransferase involved in cell wall biosynthesis
MVKAKKGVMKILFFIDGLIAGGKERRLLELLKGIKSGFNVEFELVVMNREIHYQEVFDLGIKVHYLIRKTKKDASVFSKFYKICKSFKPDIIHCWDSMTAVYSIPASKLLNIKLVNGMVVDAPERFNFFNRYWFRVKFAFLFSDIIIGNSKAGLKAYHAPSRKSTYIYNGFDFKRIKSIEEPGTVKTRFKIKSPVVVLMVGAFGDRKDYDSFVDAAKIICTKREGVEFIAVGDGKNFERISGKINGNTNDRIKLLGRQSDVESIINISDICVLTTNIKVHGEGISNSILEYMALGKPVIASSGGGTNEIVEDSTTGFLINPLSPGELAEKIEILIDDPERRARFGQAGLEKIKTKFSIDLMVNEYISLYESICKNELYIVKTNEHFNN